MFEKHAVWWSVLYNIREFEIIYTAALKDRLLFFSNKDAQDIEHCLNFIWIYPFFRSATLVVDDCDWNLAIKKGNIFILRLDFVSYLQYSGIKRQNIISNIYGPKVKEIDFVAMFFFVYIWRDSAPLFFLIGVSLLEKIILIVIESKIMFVFIEMMNMYF